ncbi:uncharacterized protein [Blastocystis hominis]|uniref:Calponin-homology (CH) domain-containing protein n=1 Tax=Blastocystis hominis TaxID=12968 RepID=D8MB49_BLAHO|nr:uncharacterized protein [Blastocystis hominis]CBK25288.2 unnamed protein product [Blastocystis hominis]|eukprot:XP_012899336.1 uncharacterized protein [Blastocystis hominis]
MSGINKATRVEIIQWLKDTLLVSINKFEEVYNGAFSCQIIDILFPSSMPMSKVNFLAKEPFEIQKNYRLIQSVFTAKNVQFNIPIENLSRGRPQDNLEFLQFLKNLYDKLYEERDYDPIKRRQYSKGGKDFNLSERDRELRQNEQILSSGRCSIGSATFSQRTVRSSTLAAPPTAPQRHGTLRLGEPMKQVDDLKHKLRTLEEKINERDRLIEALQKEGTSMYQALQRVESFAQDAEARGEKTVGINELLEVL